MPSWRRIGFVGASIAVLVAAGFVSVTEPAAGAAAPSHAYRADDYADGQAMSILPAGENGLVNVTDALRFTLFGQRPKNSDDQLGKYRDLLYGRDSVTDASLGDYYNDESFGVRAADITRTEKPKTGVTIYRDTLDVPHIYGDTDQTLAFGAGYAQAEDRLFLMDVLRHYGSGTLASFLGASCEFEQMDHDQLLLAPYSKEQAIAQVNALPARYGAQGTLAKSMIENYVAGVNRYIDSTLLNLQRLPADYAGAAPDLLPQKWTVADVVAVAALIGGIFGRGGGNEVANAKLLQYLQGKLGRAAGSRAFTDLKHSVDPLAPTTVVDKRFPYEIPGTVDPATTALPDKGVPVTGGPVATDPNCNLFKPSLPALNIIKGLQSLPKHMSNALVVNADHSADGHPVAVFGPQVSYFAPQILSQLDLHSPGYAASGASFPGTGLVELGRGQDYAWSATSAGTDITDQRIEKICNPSGGAPSARGTYYEFRGACVPMTTQTFTETALPKLGGVGAPTVLTHTINQTRHGIVQGWTTVQGRPVAVVSQRSTYNHDIDSIVGFLGFGQPAVTHDVQSWMASAAKIGFTFNWFYVDDRDTGYFVSGLDPVRPSNIDPNLPTWGTGNSEWTGFLPTAQHVQQINSKQGFFVSWNNAPAPGFAAADDQFSYGQVYRSVMLVDQLKQRFAAHGNKLTRAQVVQAMATASSQDLDGLKVVPLLLKYVAGHPHSAGVQAMLDQLRPWLADGSHRRKAKPADAQDTHAPAVAIADELMPNLVQALYGAILADGGASKGPGGTVLGYDVLPMSFVNSPHLHQGSAYDGGYESYVMSTLQQLLGRNPVDGFGADLRAKECTGGPATCSAAIEAALRRTYDSLVAANKSAVVPTWTATTETVVAKQTMPEFDAIQFTALGLVGQPDIDWQNRPTFQQVIEFPRHRPR